MVKTVEERDVVKTINYTFVGALTTVNDGCVLAIVQAANSLETKGRIGAGYNYRWGREENCGGGGCGAQYGVRLDRCVGDHVGGDGVEWRDMPRRQLS
jgi:hypothetical protein